MFGSADRGPSMFSEIPLSACRRLMRTLVRRMLQPSRFYHALWRKRKPTLFRSSKQVLVRFSHLVAEQPQIKEFEIDPLLISGHDVLAVGSRCQLHPSDLPSDQLPRTAIRPYPSQYVLRWKMKNGETVTIRPIRAEDEPLMINFHERLSDRSVYCATSRG